MSDGGAEGGASVDGQRRRDFRSLSLDTTGSAATSDSASSTGSTDKLRLLTKGGAPKAGGKGGVGPLKREGQGSASGGEVAADAAPTGAGGGKDARDGAADGHKAASPGAGGALGSPLSAPRARLNSVGEASVGALSTFSGMEGNNDAWGDDELASGGITPIADDGASSVGRQRASSVVGAASSAAGSRRPSLASVGSVDVDGALSPRDGAGAGVGGGDGSGVVNGRGGVSAAKHVEVVDASEQQAAAAASDSSAVELDALATPRASGVAAGSDSDDSDSVASHVSAGAAAQSSGAAAQSAGAGAAAGQRTVAAVLSTPRASPASVAESSMRMGAMGGTHTRFTTDADSPVPEEARAGSGRRSAKSGRYFSEPDISIKCHRCGLGGHFARDCENETKQRCYLCAAPGHSASSCPDERCFYCMRPGHRGRECDVRPRQRPLPLRLWDGCAGCGDGLHDFKGCPFRKRDVKLVKCVNCQEYGHADCSTRDNVPAIDAMDGGTRATRHMLSAIHANGGGAGGSGGAGAGGVRRQVPVPSKHPRSRSSSAGPRRRVDWIETDPSAARSSSRRARTPGRGGERSSKKRRVSWQ